MALLVLAGFDRRRRAEDPEVRERRRALSMARAQLREAATRAPADALEVVADALRRMRAAAPEVEAGEIEAVLQECDTRRFAPTSGGVDEALLARANEAAEGFEARAR